MLFSFKNLKSVLFVALAAVLSSCASVVNGTHQDIKVSTAPVSGASCQLENSQGKYYLASTPGTVSVHRDAKDLTVLCKKTNLSSNKELVDSKSGNAIWGNILAGGLVGVAIDLGDDANFSYPENINVPLKKVNVATFKPQTEELNNKKNVKS